MTARGAAAIAAEIQKLGGANAAIALAVSARPFEQAFESLPVAGR